MGRNGTGASSAKHHVWDKAFIFAMALCILFYLAVLAFLNFCGFERYCNPDSFADCQVARMMWEQHTLFPEGWTFGNQFYVVATPVLAAGLYGLTGSINLAIILATEIMTILMLISFVWMIRSHTDSLMEQMLGCVLLLYSVIAVVGMKSVHAMILYSQASFYACYMITLFIVFGDYARACGSMKKRPVAWILSLLLSFGTGMQSLRQTVVMILPILAYEVFRRLRCCLKKEACPNGRNTLVRTVSYAAANLAGQFIIRKINPSNFSIYGNVEIAQPDGLWQRIMNVIYAGLEITSMEHVLMDGSPVWARPAILWYIGLVCVAGTLWLFRLKNQESAIEVCWVLCLVGIVGVCLSTVVLNITLRSIYMFTWFPLVALSGMIVLRKYQPRVKRWIVAITCVLGMIWFCMAYAPDISEISTGGETNEARMSQWATENGYEYLYGEYWSTVPKTAVYANGALTAGCWHGVENIFQKERCNIPQDIYGEEENKKALYILSDEDERQALAIAEKRGVTMTKVVEIGNYYGYVSSAPLMHSASVMR